MKTKPSESTHFIEHTTLAGSRMLIAVDKISLIIQESKRIRIWFDGEKPSLLFSEGRDGYDAISDGVEIIEKILKGSGK